MCSKSMSVKGTCTHDPDPPVRESCERYIFLLEFYICQIKSPRLSKLNEMFCVPTTVDFSFLDFKKDDKLRLTPVDPLFEPQSGLGTDRIEPFNSGKSVLFALDQNVLSDTYRDFKIKVSVSKKMPKEMRSGDVLVGKADIDMTLHFAALRKEIIDNLRYVEAAIPNPSKTYDEEVPLCFEGNIVGTISVFARISGYGQTIVTEFEAPCLEDSIRSFLFKSDDPTCEDKVLKYKCRILDPTSCNLSDIFSDAGSQKDCYVCKPPKLPCSPCRISSGARISKDKDRECKRQETKGVVHSSCIKESCKPIQTSRGPKEPCGKAVVLKVSGLLDICNEDGSNKEARVTVAPESEATDPNNLHDPDHDIFILRIGKKGLVAAGEKSDIQLEMRTPRGPDRRPPVRLETREMQTEDDDAAGKKKGAKGKKKK